MHVIIPVAGEGTRLRPHTFSVPKVLLPVAGKPILSYILDEVGALRPDKVTIIIGHLGEKIRAYLEKAYDLPFNWVMQSERKGLGHAIGMGIGKDERDPLLIILGDTIFEADLSGIVKAGVSAIGVKEVDNPRRFGVVELDGDRVAKLVEKPEIPKSNLAIVGLYYIQEAGKLSRAVQELISRDIRTKNEYQLTDALQLMVDKGEILTPFRIDGWYDCGKPETLLQTNAHFLTKRSSKTHRENCLILDPVFIASDAEVSHSVIGPHVSVSAGAVVERAIVRNSIFCEGARVNDIILEDSIVGPEAIVEGTVSRLHLGERSHLKKGGIQG